MKRLALLLLIAAALVFTPTGAFAKDKKHKRHDDRSCHRDDDRRYGGRAYYGRSYYGRPTYVRSYYAPVRYVPAYYAPRYYSSSHCSSHRSSGLRIVFGF